MSSATQHPTVLLIGASRGLGLANGHQRIEPDAGDRDVRRSHRPGEHDRDHVLLQGSIANNDRGGFEIYRASKSALNQLMRSYAAGIATTPEPCC